MSIHTVLNVVVGAALVGAASSAILPSRPASADLRAADCRVVDGDTLRCAGERIRLLGIDAPELDGHCRAGRQCVAGDAAASRLSLAEAMRGGLRIERLGRDRYGRTLALVSGQRGDLSCWQLRRAQAIYKPAWDNRRRLASVCSIAK